MITLKVEFKVRYIGEQLPKTIVELVDVESDSRPQEIIQQINEYYMVYIVRPENLKIGQTYPYKILK
jgi:hypothetical protein